jgi:chemotaxis protein histidine kinase CheA
MVERAGRYLGAAFTYHWNLLFVGAGVAVGLISGRPDVVLPLVAAGEVFYLASMFTNDRFRSAVDAQDAKARRAADSADTRAAYDRIRSQLPPHLLRRFDQLRAHCQKLTELAGSLRGPGASGPDKGGVESLERLLWGHLRMIWNAAKLTEFLDHTDDDSLRQRAAQLERRLESLPADAASAPLRVAVEDNLRTTRERLANIAEARHKLDVVAAEIERLEAKIAALAEGAVARRDVSEIAQRVDEVAEGMRRTDETMRQLQLPPELEEIDEPPALLREEA